MPSVVVHGTRRGYREIKCRCDECRAWHAAEFRAYRASRKARTGLAQKRRASRVYQSAELVACIVCGLPMLGGWIRSDSPTHNACRPPKHWTHSIQISQVEREAIYERDGWLCQICSQPVPRGLDYRDRMSPTLDHIIPRSWTLFPDDSPQNRRLAHRACNSARGNRAA